jgi:uncharacterized protein
MSGIPVKLALVTGASAGIGAEFARQLAAAGARLILVARRRERLEALAAELRARHGVEVEVLQADLSRREDAHRVAARIAELKDLDLLVNNAGRGSGDKFSRSELGPQLETLELNAVSGVILSRAALGVMIPRDRGFIVNVASVAAFTPYSWAMYGSTKAFQVAFSENLAYELAPTGIRVQALCPGFTYTEFHDVIHMDRSTIPKFMWMQAPPVVRTSLRALGRRKVVCVPGWRNKLFASALRFGPAAWLIRQAARLRIFRKKAGY